MTDDFAATPPAAPMNLPNDLWEGLDVDNPAAIWKHLNEQEGVTTAQAVDFVGRLASEQKAAGHKNFIARTVALIEDEAALKTVAQNYKLFDTFRSPEGLGWSFEKFKRYPKHRLRPFSDRSDWTKNNVDAVEQILERQEAVEGGKLRGLNEDEIRAQINEYIRAEREAAGKDIPAKPAKLVTFEATMSEDERTNLIWALEALARKNASAAIPFSTATKQRLGLALIVMMGDCLNNPANGDLLTEIEAEWKAGEDASEAQD